MSELKLQRLSSIHAPEISACFRRAYGDRYGHGLFYDVAALGDALDTGTLMSVGALDTGGRVVAHMAMTRRGDGCTPDLGNTVVDDGVRGDGLAWRVGAELIHWCRELGHEGFLHYPTTEHKIMQRQSVKQGFETGLMMSYILTDEGQREAATVVYEPISPGTKQRIYLPEAYTPLIKKLARQSGLEREVLKSESAGDELATSVSHLAKRGLSRLTVFSGGAGLEATLMEFARLERPCLQVDLVLNDAAVSSSWQLARDLGFVFAAWLPGYAQTDVLRLQKWDQAKANNAPQLANPQAADFFELIGQELSTS